MNNAEERRRSIKSKANYIIIANTPNTEGLDKLTDDQRITKSVMDIDTSDKM